MASAGYFQQFPVISYQNSYVVDISRRSKVLDSIILNPYLFYPYTIENDMRPDVIARKYYDDMYYSWIIYLSNLIIDPYYDWKLSDEELQNHLIEKFGNLTDPQIRVVKWLNNYYNDNRVIPQSVYYALPDVEKRYWTPIYQANASFQNYLRVLEDWTTNVNQIKSLTFNGNTDFKENDLCTFYLAGTPIGSAMITRVQNNVLTYNLVLGYTDNYLWFATIGTNNFIVGETLSLMSGANTVTVGTLISLGTNNTAMVLINEELLLNSISSFKGMESNSSVNVTSSLTKQSQIVGYNNQSNLVYNTVNSLIINIPLSEQAYWSPVTEYDLENNRNVYNGTIRLIDKSYAAIALTNLKLEMNS